VLPVSAKQQLKLDFEPAITEQFRTLKQCVAAVVYGSRAGLGGCAIACDVSPSTLSRMLNEQEHEENKRNFPLDFLDPIIEVTKDTRPIQWLGAKHLPNEEQRKEAAISRVESMLPELLAALGTLKGGKK
jgi:hypothetical protein